MQLLNLQGQGNEVIKFGNQDTFVFEVTDM